VAASVLRNESKRLEPRPLARIPAGTSRQETPNPPDPAFQGLYESIHQTGR
jgi:hypothetical protein